MCFWRAGSGKDWARSWAAECQCHGTHSARRTFAAVGWPRRLAEDVEGAYTSRRSKRSSRSRVDRKKTLQSNQARAPPSANALAGWSFSLTFGRRAHLDRGRTGADLEAIYTTKGLRLRAIAPDGAAESRCCCHWCCANAARLGPILCALAALLDEVRAHSGFADRERSAG